MKKTSDLHALYSNQNRQNSVFQQGIKTNNNNRSKSSMLKFFKSATNKVVGVLTFFRFRPRKVTGSTAADRKSHQVRRISFSNDTSAGSNSKTSSNFSKSTSSYDSLSSSSGLVGTTSFSIEDICKATGNFSPANIIGEGAFGTVFKGRLRDGTTVAVKRAKKNTHDKHLPLEFKNEVLTLSKIEHLNLVRLYGYAERGDERLIVVEYVGNGTLREHLDGKYLGGLEIAERLDIAIDVAHAITYLHMYTDPPIIHRDIKSTNVLITEKLRAKVADFGFARLTPEDPAVTHISTQIKGTTGYLDPEYLRTYQLTEKSDVYSFGVLLVELMTGRYPIEHNKPSRERVTIKWAMQMLKKNDTILVMDPIIRRSPASNMAMERVLRLAKHCLAPTRQSRPSMKECGEVLWKIRKDLRDGISLPDSPTVSASNQSADFPHRDARTARNTTFGVEDDRRQFVSA